MAKPKNQEPLLLDTTQVGEILSVLSSTVRRYLYESSAPGRRYSSNPFPPPDGHLNRRSYWLMTRVPEIEAWDLARKQRRRKL